MENTLEDCAVCMQKYNHPAKLPCDHIFCFLCVKGVMRRNHNCPMCRTPIPLDYLDNPVFINETENEIVNDFENEKYWWYYEGRDGWWSYDERSNDDLESDFNAGKTECKLLVAGAMYCVDFNTMIQFQLNDPGRRRKVKRDSIKHPSKGIAGIRKNIPSFNSNNNNDTTLNVNQISPTNSPENETDVHSSDNVVALQANDIEAISQSLSFMSIQEAENPSSPSPENT
ncbi:E3 ubiquitin-protein ligase rnf146 [Zerene cesonia]|uniref:E3 ubiquitin-protein ligase rnf146 n=1 Tax=Zerene cesonia TaxID=33412 RepID=UPI0018E5269B|nr:E3 ubiquitin-protein ligase rnf146 [Zerene cesonia]